MLLALFTVECDRSYNFPSLSFLLLLKLSCLFHFNRKMNSKKRNTLMEFKHLLFYSGIDLFDVKDFKRNLTNSNLIRK